MTTVGAVRNQQQRLTVSASPAFLVTEAETATTADRVRSKPHLFLTCRNESVCPEALAELKGVTSEAVSKGYDPPSTKIVEEANRLFWVLGGNRERRGFMVYPGPDGGITLDAQIGDNFIMVICKPDHSALCVAELDNEKLSRKYESTRDIPDIFIEDAFRKLDLLSDDQDHPTDC